MRILFTLSGSILIFAAVAVSSVWGQQGYAPTGLSQGGDYLAAPPTEYAEYSTATGYQPASNAEPYTTYYAYEETPSPSSADGKLISGGTPAAPLDYADSYYGPYGPEPSMAAVLQNGITPAPMKQFGQFFWDAWISAGGTSNNQWPLTYGRGGLLDDASPDFSMNQFYLTMGRQVNRGGTWDLGGRVDLLYGTDYLPVSSLGLESYNNDNGRPASTVYAAAPKWNQNSAGGYPAYGLAMPQAYAEIYAPLLAGLSVKGGHFYSPLGYESFCSVSNFFYSHSYSMLYGQPQTLTGLLAEQRLNESWSLLGGVSQGWNTWESSNDAYDILAGFKWGSYDHLTSLAFMVMTGDTLVESRRANRNADWVAHNDRQSNYSLVFQHQFAPNWTWVLEHDLGVTNQGGYYFDENMQRARVNAQWYSVVNYLYWQMDPRFAVGFRAEWFKDKNYNRVFTGPSRNDALGTYWKGDNFIDLAVGFNWKPLPYLTIRPEVRWDYSDMVEHDQNGVVTSGIFKNMTRKDMLSVGGDMVFRF